MFTGIIEDLGEIIGINKKRSNISISIASKRILEDLKIGDSVSVNGVCLTAVATGDGSFVVDAVSETLKNSNIAGLKVKDKVNLERAVIAGDRLSGHIVSGHVDAQGRIQKKGVLRGSVEILISFPEHIKKYFVKKGSVAIDGVSLTIADIISNSIKIAVIPHTLESTTLGAKREGDAVNIEVDVLGKYVEKSFDPEEKSRKKRALRPAMY